MRKIKSALISLSDKTNLKPLLQVLKKNKVKIISSGGTYKIIKKLGFKCLEVSKFTNSAEILEGRVKTLHPKIHAGILNKRDNKTHSKEMKTRGFQNIDLVIVNFYPFEKAINEKKNHGKIIENIDIGGPTMVRAAAKNYNDVTVITSHEQYFELIDELKINKGSTSLKFREKISKISFPEKKIIHKKLVEKLRYGENPHQESALYSDSKSLLLNQIHGKTLSYNNYNDIFSALRISKTLPKNKGTVIIKHANPCGVSILDNKIKSYQSALACDPLSAFGGIVSFNFKVTQLLASELKKNFYEVIIANGFDRAALKILKSKKNLRLIDASKFSLNENIKFNSFENSILMQSTDNQHISKKNIKIVSKKKPNKTQIENLLFAFNICRFVKSNAIVLVSNKSTVGIGSGQPSRLDSCQIAIDKMDKFNNTQDEIVAASDAFFPFQDGIEKLIQSGVSAVIQPSGSIRDKDIISFANATGTVLVFSKTRHFNH